MLRQPNAIPDFLEEGRYKVFTTVDAPGKTNTEVKVLFLDPGSRRKIIRRGAHFVGIINLQATRFLDFKLEILGEGTMRNIAFLHIETDVYRRYTIRHQPTIDTVYRVLARENSLIAFKENGEHDG